MVLVLVDLDDVLKQLFLQEAEDRLIAAKTKAWNDRFAAESEAYPPTLESILWIVAKSGFTNKVAPLMNLSKATRECKNLQRYMREERNRRGMTQLHYFCEHGMTSSVVRMLEMRSIDVKGRRGGREDGVTCLMTTSDNGHLEICRLLLDKGAQLEAKDSNDNECGENVGDDDTLMWRQRGIAFTPPHSMTTFKKVPTMTDGTDDGHTQKQTPYCCLLGLT